MDMNEAELHAGYDGSGSDISGPPAMPAYRDYAGQIAGYGFPNPMIDNRIATDPGAFADWGALDSYGMSARQVFDFVPDPATAQAFNQGQITQAAHSANSDDGGPTYAAPQVGQSFGQSWWPVAQPEEY